MIYAQNTTNNTGVAICGDYNDFNNLYGSLHTVVGNEEEHPALEQSRLRVLGLCYDLRHAFMGDREILFVDNGINEDVKRFQSVICSDKNVYMKIKMFWPETLFIIMVLNELLDLHAESLAKKHHIRFTDSKTIWNLPLVTVRQFQAAIMHCLSETVTAPTFSRMLNIMNSEYLTFRDYLTQYIDLLNYRFVKMSPEKRLKNISIMAKRIAQRDKDYIDLEDELESAAREQGYPRESFELQLELPKKIDW
ncbi:DUF6904 family protein [Dethiobacter alkaliphilus]|uniref:Uncharacterized protein n=1 Tax=Dethiobacter alkaliphilus AHT 1 TaxID=555088 RepID=C0GFL2_DETAL|nr:hypothetical protein [Dethiobacter alkaliphilus]EEG77972.1 conserved hypothetical protein [Dethiobacter alkaliphilus AHT 1]